MDCLLYVFLLTFLFVPSDILHCVTLIPTQIIGTNVVRRLDRKGYIVVPSYLLTTSVNEVFPVGFEQGIRPHQCLHQ